VACLEECSLPALCNSKVGLALLWPLCSELAAARLAREPHLRLVALAPLLHESGREFIARSGWRHLASKCKHLCSVVPALP
jgi:hypothetical protein